MNAKLAFALSIALVTTAGCSSMGSMFSGSSGDSRSMDSSMSSSMREPAPVPVDPAGTATSGTGSVSTTAARDQPMIKGSGIGM